MCFVDFEQAAKIPSVIVQYLNIIQSCAGIIKMTIA